MAKEQIKARITMVKKPIEKQVSSFVKGNTKGPKKIIPNKDAYKRQ